jgi:hypothetical protein
MVEERLTELFLKNLFSYYSIFSTASSAGCRPSDSTVPTNAGIEPRTVALGVQKRFVFDTWAR